MAERWFLKIDGIEGESTVSSHKGEIDIQSWSWGVTNESSSGPGGGAGRPSVSDFQFVSRISKASPALFRSCATGTHHKSATLTGAEARRLKAEFLVFKLSDVVVTQYHQSDGADMPPTEQFSLNFAKIELAYSSQDKTGKLGPPVTASYDVKQNKF